MKEKFYHSLLPHVLLMCSHIKIFRYLVTGCHKKTKTVKFLEVVPKRKAVLTEMLLCRAIFKNVLGLLIEDDL